MRGLQARHFTNFAGPAPESATPKFTICGGPIPRLLDNKLTLRATIIACSERMPLDVNWVATTSKKHDSIGAPVAIALRCKESLLQFKSPGGPTFALQPAPS